MARRKNRPPAPDRGRDWSRPNPATDFNPAGENTPFSNPRLPRRTQGNSRYISQANLADQLLSVAHLVSLPSLSAPPQEWPSIARRTPRVYLPPRPATGYGPKPNKALYGPFASLKTLHTPEAFRARHCLDRKSRREVLFALRKAGKSGIGRNKRWRRTQASNYHC